MSGTSALRLRRTMAANRITGTDTNMTMKAAASPIVMGKPRSTVRARDAFGESCRAERGALAATEIPTAKGMSRAKAIQTIRTAQEGTACGIGTKASKRAAILGAAIPRRRIG